MNELTCGPAGAVAGDRTRALFGLTMGYVAIAAGFFALGAYLGRHLPEGWAFAWFIVAFGCLIGMNFTARRAGSVSLSTALLLVVGAALGLAMAPVLVWYADTSPQALWQAGGATALFIAGFGATGYATRRD